MCNVDGSSRSVLIDTTSIHPFGLSIYKNQLFWTDWKVKSIVHLDISSGNYTSLDIQFPSLTKPSAIVVRDPVLRNGKPICCHVFDNVDGKL